MLPEIKGEFLQVCRETAVTAVGHQPHGTLQMVNRPVTMGTINDYMHKRNGQNKTILGELSLEVLKPALLSHEGRFLDHEDDNNDGITLHLIVSILFRSKYNK